MNGCFITFRSVTHAQRGEQVRGGGGHGEGRGVCVCVIIQHLERFGE